MTSPDFEKRLRTLEDIEEIKQIQAQYVNHLILADFDGVVDCFTEDALVDLHAGTVRGREAMLRLFKEKIALYHRGMEGLFVVHPIISVEGDTAKGNWLLYLQYAAPRTLVPRLSVLNSDQAPDWMQGFYEMEYQRVDGRWKISSLKWRARLVSPLTLVKKEDTVE